MNDFMLPGLPPEAKTETKQIETSKPKAKSKSEAKKATKKTKKK